jgi:polar amino acid transport system substrate-binding protein
MHPRPAISFILICACLLIACGSSLNASSNAETDTACQLRVTWDPYEPYSYSDGDESPVGYDIDVVSKVAEMIGCSLTFSEMAWSDILVALQNGDTDISVGTGYKTDRAKWSWYSESYRNEIIGLMLRAGTADQFAGSSLEEVLQSGLKFGKTTDDTYDAATEASFAKYPDQIWARVSEEENLARLLDGSIDGFLVEVNVAAATAARINAESRVALHPLEFSAGAYRLQMSKKTVTADRVIQINAAIQELAANGWLESSLHAYSIHGRAQQEK